MNTELETVWQNEEVVYNGAEKEKVFKLTKRQVRFCKQLKLTTEEALRILEVAQGTMNFSTMILRSGKLNWTLFDVMHAASNNINGQTKPIIEKLTGFRFHSDETKRFVMNFIGLGEEITLRFRSTTFMFIARRFGSERRTSYSRGDALEQRYVDEYNTVLDIEYPDLLGIKLPFCKTSVRTSSAGDITIPSDSMTLRHKRDNFVQYEDEVSQVNAHKNSQGITISTLPHSPTIYLFGLDLRLLRVKHTTSITKYAYGDHGFVSTIRSYDFFTDTETQTAKITVEKDSKDRVVRLVYTPTEGQRPSDTIYLKDYVA